jgi:hypothetical protein
MTDDEWAYYEPFLIRCGGRPRIRWRRRRFFGGSARLINSGPSAPSRFEGVKGGRCPRLWDWCPRLRVQWVLRFLGAGLVTFQWRPAARIPALATLTMPWKGRACPRTSILVHRSAGRTTSDFGKRFALAALQAVRQMGGFFNVHRADAH